MTVKEEILEILRDALTDDMTQEAGTEELLGWLESSDYFTAPASTKYHLARPGGLAEHSLNVYRLFCRKNEEYNLGLPKRTLAICGLLHDACKVGVYGPAKRSGSAYSFEDRLPLGHAEKSLFVLSRFIRLTEQEAMIIRWHMGIFDASIHFSYPNGMSFNDATKRCPAVVAFICADMEASMILESGVHERDYGQETG